MLLWGAASCTNDDSVGYASDPSAVRIAATVGANSIFSRSNPTGDATEQAAFNTGDAIAIAAGDQTAVRYIKGEGDAWAPSSASAFLRWTADQMTFKAYYPVVDGASMTTFTVPTDQTTVAKIAKADYMTFSGLKDKPATAGEGISIEMQRQMARVILNISFNDQFTGEETLSNVTVASPADLTTEATTARIQPYSPVAKNYVAVVIPGMESGAADFITLTVGTTSLTAKLTQAIEAGKSYTFALTVGKDLLTVESVTVSDWTNTAIIPGGEAVWATVVGDYYYSDNTYSTEYNSAKTCVGIVYWVGDPSTNDAALRTDHPTCTHGLVVALEECAASYWQTAKSDVNAWVTANTSYSPILSGTGATDPINKIMGYNNTKAIEAFNADAANSGNIVTPVANVVDYRTSNPAPTGTSDWFMPSMKELTLLCGLDNQDANVFDNEYGTGNRDAINSKLSAISTTKIANSDSDADNPHYWSSTERYDGSVWFEYFNVYGGRVRSTSKSYNSYRVRAVFAF